MCHDPLGVAVVLRRAASKLCPEIRPRRLGEYDNPGAAIRRHVADSARELSGNAATVALTEDLQRLYGPETVPGGDLRNVRVPREQLAVDTLRLADAISNRWTDTNGHTAALEHELRQVRAALADLLRLADPTAYATVDPDATPKCLVRLIRRALTAQHHAKGTNKTRVTA